MFRPISLEDSLYFSTTIFGEFPGRFGRYIICPKNPWPFIPGFNPIPSILGVGWLPPLNLLDDDKPLLKEKWLKLGVTNPPKKDGGRLDFQGKGRTTKVFVHWCSLLKFPSTQWLDGTIGPISYVEAHIETQSWNKQLLQLNVLVFVAFQLSVFLNHDTEGIPRVSPLRFLVVVLFEQVFSSIGSQNAHHFWVGEASLKTYKIQTPKTIPRNPNIILRKGFSISSYSGDGIGTLKSNSIGRCLDS